MQTSFFVTSITISLVIFSLGFVSQASAEEEIGKQQLLAEAAGICHDAAEKRYGENSLRSIASAKWDRGLGGVKVKIKVKPKGERKQKYSCVVKADNSVLFHKI